VGHDERSPPERGAHGGEHRPAAHSELAATLVEPFQRGSERIRTDHAGVGLGLAIVKSITQAHDGTLTLTPRAAGGLRVMVQLPAAPPQVAA
jgi:two-component system sensor histidine kinase VanS